MGAKMFDGKLARAAGVQQSVKYINDSVAVVNSFSAQREEYLRAFRVMDEQDAINRYHWFNIPAELSSQDIERLLYYRGQLCFFYFKDLDKFFFMPYALAGSIDFYGRYNAVHPIPFSQGTEGSTEAEKKESKARYLNQKELLSKILLECVYDVFDEEVSEEDLPKYTVLLHDYAKQRSEIIIPRQIVNDCFLNVMADMLSYFETASMIGTGIKGYRVESGTAKEEVKNIANSIYQSAINRTPYVALTGSVDWQDLASSAAYKVADYLMAFQGVDNMRLSTYGIANGGVYEKQAHILESEMAINSSSVYSPLEDGLKIRQRFCNIVNSIFGTSLWCEPSEAALKVDIDGDGFDYDRVDTPEEEQEQEGGEQE